MTKDEQDEDYFMIPCIAAMGTTHKYTVISVGKIQLSCLINTGAEVNVLSEISYYDLGQPELHPPKKRLYAYGPEGSRAPLPVLGTMKTAVHSAVTRKTAETEFHVIRGKAENLLGQRTAVDLEPVSFAQAVVSPDPTTTNLINPRDLDPSLQTLINPGSTRRQRRQVSMPCTPTVRWDYLTKM